MSKIVEFPPTSGDKKPSEAEHIQSLLDVIATTMSDSISFHEPRVAPSIVIMSLSQDHPEAAKFLAKNLGNFRPLLVQFGRIIRELPTLASRIGFTPKFEFDEFGKFTTTIEVFGKDRETFLTIILSAKATAQEWQGNDKGLWSVYSVAGVKRGSEHTPFDLTPEQFEALLKSPVLTRNEFNSGGYHELKARDVEGCIKLVSPLNYSANHIEFEGTQEVIYKHSKFTVNYTGKEEVKYGG